MRISNYLLCSFLLLVELFEAEGIQGGSLVSSLEKRPIDYIGSMSIPALKEMHRCTTILVREDVAITAGHCLIYDTKMSFALLLDFDVIQVYVRMGALEYDRGLEQLVYRGYIHNKFKKIDYSGLTAENNIGALKLEHPFSTIKNLIGLMPYITNENDRFNAVHLNKEFVKSCQIVSWGATTVLPILDSDLCSTVSCREEIESRCYYKQNKQLKTLDVLLESREDCVANIRPQGRNQAKDMKQELQAALNATGALCHQPKQPEKNESITLGDEGAPVICTVGSKVFTVGMHVGGRIEMQRTGNVRVKIPSFFLDFLILEHFAQEIDRVLVHDGSPTAFRPFSLQIFVSVVANLLI